MKFNQKFKNLNNQNFNSSKILKKTDSFFILNPVIYFLNNLTQKFSKKSAQKGGFTI